MSDVNILIADNDPDALKIYGEYLESAGYNVLKAAGIAEARELMNTRRVHLAVLDLRLTDDSENDRSGLLLAREFARSTPKLLLTKWPTYVDVREALKLDEESLPPAVDFLDKKDGLEKLGEAVRQALLKYVRINHGLVIQRGRDSNVSFFGLAGALSPGGGTEALRNYAEELEELFRRLFYEKSQIKIDRPLWQRGGRAALAVFAFAEGGPAESLVVVCGRKPGMEEERRRYSEFAPSAPGHNSTVLQRVGETAHFAAHAYTLAGAGLEALTSLEELYRTAPDRPLAAAFRTLFEGTLAEWHEEKRVAVEAVPLARLYGGLLGLPGRDELLGALDERIELVVRQLPALGPEVRRSGGKLKVSFGGEAFSYPDPTAQLDRLYSAGGPTLLMKTPGLLLGSNVLADQTGHTWLTDFSAASLAPMMWNYVSLEAVVRFDWVEAHKLQWLHELERQLIGPEFAKLYASEVEAPLRKALRAVQGIRRLASRQLGRQEQDYHDGVLFHALRRIADYDPTLQLTASDLSRLAHLLLASSMLLARLGAAKGGEADRAKGIHIDHDNRAVSINGVRVLLRGQSYDLLHELYLHANQLCTRASIVERVFGERYEENNDSQISRLNTAVRRLREKIEEEPDNPQYLLTEPHGGYKLIPRPQGE